MSEPDRQSIRIEHNATRGARLNQYMDAMDLALLMILLIFLPVGGRQIFGANGFLLALPGLVYIVWMWIFKINKPPSYFKHWLKFHNRSRLWGSGTYEPIDPFPQDEERGEGSVIQKAITRNH